MNVLFNVFLFSWYYEYIGDLNFLWYWVYFYICFCGDFYEDYMQKEIYGKLYCYIIMIGGYEDLWDLNFFFDLVFVKQMFGLLVRYSKLLGVD